MAWREELHPRHPNGRFAPKGTTPAVSITKTLANLGSVSDDDLFDVFHRMSSRKQLDRRSLAIVDAELARREGLAKLPPPDDTPEQVRLDDMVRRGASYAEAYADVYGGPQGAAEATVERRKGETTHQARRRAYSELVALQALQAEEATRGHLLRGGCQHVDPMTLWSAPPNRALKCASEELQRWWADNGGRLNYDTWLRMLSGKRRQLVGARSEFEA